MPAGGRAAGVGAEGEHARRGQHALRAGDARPGHARIHRGRGGERPGVCADIQQDGHVGEGRGWGGLIFGPEIHKTLIKI